MLAEIEVLGTSSPLVTLPEANELHTFLFLTQHGPFPGYARGRGHIAWLRHVPEVGCQAARQRCPRGAPAPAMAED